MEFFIIFCAQIFKRNVLGKKKLIPDPGRGPQPPFLDTLSKSFHKGGGVILTPKGSNTAFSFADEIAEQDASLYMVSFDVESLFTNIPLDETIKICADRVFQKKKKVKGLLKRHFVRLLTFATKSSFFLFNGTYYSQIDGVAMGSPLGPTLANLFLAYYEEKWLHDCPVQFKPKFYRRYVDDIFLLFDKHDQVKKFLRYMNSRHKNIKFTYEEEQNDSMSFLDIKITREVGKLTTSVYRKKTFSGVVP